MTNSLDQLIYTQTDYNGNESVNSSNLKFIQKQEVNLSNEESKINKTSKEICSNNIKSINNQVQQKNTIDLLPSNDQKQFINSNPLKKSILSSPGTEESELNVLEPQCDEELPDSYINTLKNSILIDKKSEKVLDINE